MQPLPPFQLQGFGVEAVQHGFALACPRRWHRRYGRVAFYSQKQAFHPLDVHVGNISRELGLLSRKANDRKSVVELTEVLRSLRPDDPCIYDYALFGIGVEGKSVR